MKKYAFLVSLTFCLVLLLSGAAALAGQNHANAAGVPMVSASPAVIDVGTVIMGEPFNTSFTVYCNGESNLELISLHSLYCALTPGIYSTSCPGAQLIQVSATAPQTYGSFVYQVIIDGPYNTTYVLVQGYAIYPAPTNVSMVYDPDTSLLSFQCDPVPGTAQYKVLLTKMMGGVLPSAIQYLYTTTPSGQWTTNLSTSILYRYSYGVVALNSDGSVRSAASYPKYVVFQ